MGRVKDKLIDMMNESCEQDSLDGMQAEAERAMREGEIVNTEENEASSLYK